MLKDLTKSEIGILLILLLLSLWPSFYNGYPLIGNDTGSYLSSGHSGKIPVDRPIYYGLFVRHISLSWSLWIPIIIQNLILLLCTYSLFLLFNNSKNKVIYFAILYSLLSFLTPMSVTANYILPDIFTATLILSVILFLIEKRTTYKYLWVLLITFSTMCHYSHFVTLLITASSTFLITIFYKKEYKNTALKLIIISVLQFPLSMSLNHLINNKFQLSSSTFVFLTGKFLQDGHVIRLLQEHCDEYSYELCTKQERLKNNTISFLWHSNSPIYDGDCSKGEFGPCFEEKNKLYKKIVFDIIYYYPFEVLKSSLKSTTDQFLKFDLVDLLNDERINSPSPSMIIWHYEKEKATFFSSRQMNGELNFTIINLFTKLFSIVFIFCLIVSLFKKWGCLQLKAVAMLIILYLFSNALVCASLSDVAERYQSRIIFISIFAFGISLINKTRLTKTI